MALGRFRRPAPHRRPGSNRMLGVPTHHRRRSRYLNRRSRRRPRPFGRTSDPLRQPLPRARALSSPSSPCRDRERRPPFSVPRVITSGRTEPQPFANPSAQARTHPSRQPLSRASLLNTPRGGSALNVSHIAKSSEGAQECSPRREPSGNVRAAAEPRQGRKSWVYGVRLSFL